MANLLLDAARDFWEKARGRSPIDGAPMFVPDTVGNPRVADAGPLERTVQYLNDTPSPYMTKQLLRDGLKALLSGPMALEKTLRGRYAPIDDPSLVQDLVPAQVPFGANSVLSPSSNALLSIGGRLSKTADRWKVKEAENLLHRAVPADDILRRTGQMLDSSGNWFYEIPDHNFTLNLIGTHEIGQKNGFVLTPRALHPIFGNGTKLGDVVDHPELFAAYPDMKNIRVETRPAGNVKGGYYARGDIIELAPDQPEAVRNTLLHEMTHAVQNREGLTSGANSKDFLPHNYPQLTADVENNVLLLKHLIDTGGVTMPDSFIMSKLMEGRPLSKTEDVIWQNWRKDNPAGASVAEKLFESYLDKFTAERNAYTTYRNVSGEQVAEAVARRADLSPRARQNRLFFHDFDPPYDALGPLHPISQMRPGTTHPPFYPQGTP